MAPSTQISPHDRRRFVLSEPRSSNIPSNLRVDVVSAGPLTSPSRPTPSLPFICFDGTASGPSSNLGRPGDTIYESFTLYPHTTCKVGLSCSCASNGPVERQRYKGLRVSLDEA